ncbi:Putative ribonuclease H protein At1g65750 [Linum perenne]
MHVVGMSPPIGSLGSDSLVWGLEANGRFSVRSAYLMITENISKNSDALWGRIWRWNGPSKIKHFLWLVTHNRLLTNEERSRRHLTNQVLCPRCSLSTESISHVIYDYNFALQVWRTALLLTISARDEISDFGDWWRYMLMDKVSSIKFGIVAWKLWTARNKLIFEGLSQSATRVL